MLPLHDIHAASPRWLQAGITLFPILHVSAGGIAIVSGFGAILARKAERAHRLSGNAFFASMLTMSLMGATLAAILQQPSNIIGGGLAFYLVATGWATIRRKDRGVGPVEIGAFASALSATAALIVLGFQAAAGPGRQWPATLYMVFGVLAALFAALDLKVILRSGVAGPQRIARHLWRMCLALFFASGSFFLGQQKVMPVWMQGSPLLLFPALAPLVLMVFWMIRVRLAPRARHSHSMVPGGLDVTS